MGHFSKTLDQIQRRHNVDLGADVDLSRLSSADDFIGCEEKGDFLGGRFRRVGSVDRICLY